MCIIRSGKEENQWPGRGVSATTVSEFKALRPEKVNDVSRAISRVDPARYHFDLSREPESVGRRQPPRTA